MTRAEIPGIRIFGRPFKPLAVGLIIGGFTLSVNTILLFVDQNSYIPVPGIEPMQLLTIAPTTFFALLMGIFAFLSTLLMVVAWFIKSQRLYEYGLLLSFGAWTSHWLGIALDGDIWYAMLPFAVSFMAAGAYWLERADEHNGMG